MKQATKKSKRKDQNKVLLKEKKKKKVSDIVYRGINFIAFFICQHRFVLQLHVLIYIKLIKLNRSSRFDNSIWKTYL